MKTINIGKTHNIGNKVNALLLSMVLFTMLLAGSISIHSLYSMKNISQSSSSRLGQTAADNAENALEAMAVENLKSIAVEKSAYIEEKFAAVETYVLGIAAQAQNIYEQPQKYPDREVALPKPDSTELAAQLLWSEKINEIYMESGLTSEVLKLGNVQDLLVQYNANNDMVSSTYLATRSGWMIQADYIAYKKYDMSSDEELKFYEVADRQWYRRALDAMPGQVIYTDVIRDVHKEKDCIVCASPVYYKGQVVAVAGVGAYLETVNDAVLNTSIGENGYAFLVNEKGQVLVSGREKGETAALSEQQRDLRESSNAALAKAAKRMVAGQSDAIKLTLDNTEVYIAYAPLHRLGWSFVTVLNVEEVIAPAKASQNIILTLTEEVALKQDDAIRHMLISFVTVLVVTALFIGLFGALFSRKLTEPIQKLTEEVAQIDGGNLDYRICIDTGDEIEALGNAFNHMTAQIQSYITNLAAVTAEKERIRTEIEVASRLQADMLPKVEGIFKDKKEFSLATAMIPAKGVGGDFYDFFLLDKEHLALIMADVSGKGVPAALFMVVSRTLIRSHMIKNLPLEQAVTEINESLCANNKNGMFVTAWIGILTISTGELIFVNAGHCRPLIKRRGGTCEYDTNFGGFVLAGMEGMPYKQAQIQLHQGDMLLLYTDGVTEATNIEKDLYGEERLKELTENMTISTPEELLKTLWEELEDFQKGEEQFDDITMLALTFHGRNLVEMTDKPNVKNMKSFVDFVEENLKTYNVPMTVIYKVQMAVDEILSNICYYSNATEVTLRIQVEETEPQKIIILFEDDGIPYNPLERPEPDVTDHFEMRSPGGLGIYLVKKRMDHVDYEYRGNKNCLTICKIF